MIMVINKQFAFFRNGLIAFLVLFVAGAASSVMAQDMMDQSFKFAMITSAQPGDSFFSTVRKGANTAAKKHGVELLYLPGPTPEKEAAKLKNAITQGVDGIAINITFPNALAPLIKQAKDAGIPVVGFISGFGSWKSIDGVLMYVGQDERLTGQAVGNRLNAEGIEKVVCVNQQQGAAQLAARCGGIEDTFEGIYETLYLQGYDMSAARSRMMAKLIADPSIGALVTLGAPFAPVAATAVNNANSSAEVVTFDLNPRVAKLIKTGTVKWAVDQQPFLEGYEAMSMLWLYKVNGDNLGGGEAVLTGPAFVDADNIDQIMPYVKRGTR